MDGRPIGRLGPPMSGVHPMELGHVDVVMAIAAGLPSAPQWPRQAYLEMFDSLEPPLRLKLVAVAQSTVVGYVIVRTVAQEAELESIAVAASAQRLGIAKFLLQSVIWKLCEAGIERLFLEVRASNEGAAAFYRRSGFREIGRRPNYYSEPMEDAVLMELSPLERPSWYRPWQVQLRENSTE